MNDKEFSESLDSLDRWILKEQPEVDDMEQGKCAKCGKTTYPDKKGKLWDNCFDCNQKERDAKAKQDELPIKSAQEETGEIFQVFKNFKNLLHADDEKADATIVYATALGLTTQYWSNHRTPGGVK